MVSKQEVGLTLFVNSVRSVSNQCYTRRCTAILALWIGINGACRFQDKVEEADDSEAEDRSSPRHSARLLDNAPLATKMSQQNKLRPSVTNIMRYIYI